MGFYSLYRIFKDIIKSIFGNKAWRYTLIIAIIVTVFTIFSVKSNASDLRPWNVYTNTTEFNWNRLVAMNYHETTGSNNAYDNEYSLSSEQVYYIYNPNSSTGTLRLWCRPTNDDNNLILLTEDHSTTSFYPIETNFLYDGAYVDIPFNTLFTPQFHCRIEPSSSSNYEFYMLDDKYSNIETYNELAMLIDTIQGANVDKATSPTNVTGLSVSNGGGNGSFQTGNSNIYYFELDTDKVNNFDFSIISRFEGFAHVYGYCNAIPSNDVAYTYLGSCVNATQFNNITVSVPKGAKYFFVRLNGGNSTFTLNNYSVSYGGLDEVNQQVINQGNQTRETLTDSNISQDTADYTLPTDSTNDITASGFASIFDRIKNTFTSPTSTPIVINVPFTGKTFTISKQTVYGSANLGIVQTLIECFWWYIIGLFVCKDVFKKIEKLKTGNIEFTETTNIKEDIL